MPRRKLDPLPDAAFQILLALAGGDLHGYAICGNTHAALSHPAVIADTNSRPATGAYST